MLCPLHKGVRDFEYAQIKRQVNHSCTKKPPDHDHSEPHLNTSEFQKAENLPFKAAMRFLCLCCPRQYPQADSAADTCMADQLEAWYNRTHGHVSWSDGSNPEEDEDDECMNGSSEEEESENDGDNSATVEQYLVCREKLECSLLEPDAAKDTTGVAPGNDKRLEAETVDSSMEEQEVHDHKSLSLGVVEGCVRILKRHILKTAVPDMLQYMRRAEFEVTKNARFAEKAELVQFASA